MRKKLFKTAKCLNCHQKIADYNYCPHCGQLNTTKNIPLKQFFKDAMGDFFTFDSKLFNSLVPLLIKPGFLTKEYIDGKRVSYILPLRLYIFITIFFFFILSLKSIIFLDETSSETEKNVKNSSNYEKIYNKELLPFKALDSLNRKLLSYELASQYKLKKKSKTELLLLNELRMHNDSIRSNQIFFAITDHFKVYKRKRSKRSDEKDLSKLLTNEIQKDSLHTTKTIHLLDSIFDFSKSYYNPAKKSEQAVVKLIKRNQAIQTDSLAKKIFLSMKRSYYIIPIKTSNFTISDQSLTESLELDTINPSFLEKLAIRFDKKSKDAEKLGAKGFLKKAVDHIPTVMFFLLPVFALIFKILYIRRNIFYINHLIFSLHAHSIFFLYILLAILISYKYFVLCCILGIFVHLYLSMKKVYQQSHPKTLLKLLLASFSYSWVLIGGFVLLMIISVITI